MLHKKRTNNALSGMTGGDEDEEEPKGFWARLKFRTAFVHLGLVVTCITYILLGAYMFRSIERPRELQTRKEALNAFRRLQTELMGNLSVASVSPESLLDEYMENLYLLFDDPIYAHVFESHFTNYSTPKDLWTFSSAVLFTTTTVIPVGYGYVWPTTTEGRMLLVIYGMIGIPLALVTMADTGKFISQLATNIFKESLLIPTILFLGLLSVYPLLAGLLFHYTTGLSFLDATYFSLTSIFTIGFGDVTPKVNVLQLVLFIVFGVILVTITIDFVAAEIIDNVHYMGRGVGKAREIAGKMLQMAQNMNLGTRGISGLAAGMNQLQALARMGLIGKLDKETLEHGHPISAFAPVLDDDLDWMDKASLYTAQSGGSHRDLGGRRGTSDGRHLFLP